MRKKNRQVEYITFNVIFCSAICVFENKKYMETYDWFMWFYLRVFTKL